MKRGSAFYRRFPAAEPPSTTDFRRVRAGFFDDPASEEHSLMCHFFMCLFGALIWYLKAVWPDFLGALLRSGRPRGPGKAFTNAGCFAPNLFEGLPGPLGAGQTSKMLPTNPARLPSGTLLMEPFWIPKVDDFRSDFCGVDRSINLTQIAP